eukprot:6962417-Lingulodinium_polyedra.AAC.1
MFGKTVVQPWVEAKVGQQWASSGQTAGQQFVEVDPVWIGSGPSASRGRVCSKSWATSGIGPRGRFHIGPT